MPAKTVSLSIRTTPELKAKAEALFDEMGMNISTAFNIFLSQTVYERAIPFPIVRHTPNAETLAAMEEAGRIARDPNVKGYSDMKSLIAALES